MCIYPNFSASLNISYLKRELYLLVALSLVSPQVIGAAEHIVERAEEGGDIGGRTPASVCGAALFMAAQVIGFGWE